MTLIDIFLNNTFSHAWVYWIIFIATTFEASPIIGIFVPGLALAIIGGFLARVGILNFSGVLLITCIGAIIGDAVGYYLGKKYGISLIRKFPKYMLYYEKTKELMQEHAGKTLVIGRFSTLTRAFGPFVAGATKIKFKRFFFYNIVGGIVWSVTYVLLGYICGEGYERISHYTSMIVTLTLGFIVLVVYGYYIINRRKHVFTHSYIYFLILNIFTAYVFAKILQNILAQEIIIHIDVKINQYVAAISYPLLTTGMNAVAVIFDPIVLGIASIGFCAYLIYNKKWYQGLLWLLSMGSAAISVYIIKLLVHRPRPEAVLTDFSFPSGHAAMNILFFCLLFYCFKEHITTKKQRIQAIGALALFAVGIGFNRIYLHAHWFSDVIGGYAVGLFWLAFYILILKLIFYKKKELVLYTKEEKR